MKPLFNKVAIIGVGLIGGSIGLAIQKRRLAKFVVGVVRRPSSAKEAVSRGAVQMATMDLKEGLKGADLVILCAPVSTIVKQIKQLRPLLSKGAIVIDVASSKGLIAQTAKKHLKDVRFVGCHPMAGKEMIGVVNAEAGLFEGATCFVTVSDPKVNVFWKALGAKPVTLSAEKHDAWVARASHLPHILSFSLFQSLKAPKKWPVNPSLKAIHRLAQSDPELWADIFISNKKEVVRAIAEVQRSLTKFHRALSKGNAPLLRSLISKANKNAR